MEKKALGKGLGALLPVLDDKKIDENQIVSEVPVDHVSPNRNQPRKEFAEEELTKLADSIKQSGVLQPIVVRRKGDGHFELIAGERRWRATKIAGFAKVPAIIRNCSDDQAMVLALVENLQRYDLNPMETAYAYHRLATEFGMTQDHIAQQLGKDRSSVANLTRLINLPNEIKELVESGKISFGHAKVILSLTSQEEQLRLARKIVEEQLSVRQTEKLVNHEFHNKKPKNNKALPDSFQDLADRIQKRLGTKVQVTQTSKQKGKIVIHYFSPLDRERILDVLLA